MRGDSFLASIIVVYYIEDSYLNPCTWFLIPLKHAPKYTCIMVYKYQISHSQNLSPFLLDHYPSYLSLNVVGLGYMN